MNLGLRKEEAFYIRELILNDYFIYDSPQFQEVYPNLDIAGILEQLAIIIEIGDSIEDENNIFG